MTGIHPDAPVGSGRRAMEMGAELWVGLRCAGAIGFEAAQLHSSGPHQIVDDVPKLTFVFGAFTRDQYQVHQGEIEGSPGLQLSPVGRAGILVFVSHERCVLQLPCRPGGERERIRKVLYHRWFARFP